MREFRANQVGILIAQLFERRIYLALPTASRNDAFEFIVLRRTNPEARAIVGDDFERFDILDRLAGHHRMRAARIVGDHAAQRAATVRGRIWREGQAVLFRGITQRVADHTRFDDRSARRRVHRDDAIHVLARVRDHRHIHALTVLRRAAAARQQRHIITPARCDGGDEIVDIGRDDHRKRHLSVVRRIRRVKRFGCLIEPHFAAHMLPQVGF